MTLHARNLERHDSRAHADRVADLAKARAPAIGAVEVALPEHRYTQEELASFLAARWRDQPVVAARMRRMFEAVQVDTRALALPLDAYRDLRSFDDANGAFIRAGADLGARAVTAALARAGLAPRDVDAIFFTTVTGLAVPTLDARLANVLELRRDVRRTPLFGLGCVGGAAGLARAADYLRAYPDHVAVLLSVELCSLTFQDDHSIANLVASGLFADGAACVVLEGARRRRRASPGAAASDLAPRVFASQSALFPGSERVMGWDIGARGFKVVLSADVPKIVRRELPAEVDRFLAAHALARGDVARWICHPGGPKVIDAIEDALGLPPSALAITRRSLASVGNLSSASVLHVLGQTLPLAREGERGVLLAMGPGFCAELVLLAW